MSSQERPPYVIEDTAPFILAKVSTAFRNDLEKRMGAIGLHAGQIFVLLELNRSDDIKQIDLAGRLGVSAPTVSKMLTGLIEIGLVKRSKIENDARSVRVFITHEGQSMIDKIKDEWHEMETVMLTSLSQAEQIMFYELLKKLYASYKGSDPDDE